MDQHVLAVIEKEAQAAERFARSRPLSHPDDPAQVDTVLLIALNNPDFTVSQIIQAYEKLLRRPPRIHVRRLLERNRLGRSDGRRECHDAVEKQSTNFARLLQASDLEIAHVAHKELRNWMTDRSRRLSSPAVARLLLNRLAHSLQESRDPETQRVGRHLDRSLQLILLPQSMNLFRYIVHAAAEVRGFTTSTSINDSVSDLIQQVEQIEESAAEPGAGEADSLAEENADLRAALFGLKHELGRLQEQTREMQETAKAQAIVAFLAEMNSPAEGHLLDNVMHSSRIIKQLLASGWEPEPAEVEGVVYSLTMLTDHLKRLGVTPMYEIGERLRITLDDLSFVTYMGSEFRDTGQKKWVEFRSPGWKYHDQMISRPQAVEIEASTHS